MKALKVTSLAAVASALMVLPAAACDFGDQHAATSADKPVAAAPAQAGGAATVAVAPTQSPVAAPLTTPAAVGSPAGTQTADTSLDVARMTKPN
ncbi:MAG: hypothetical protein R3D67_06550 [Hyphomicrobiaceae bacterium]